MKVVKKQRNKEKNIDVFSDDARNNEGYLYTKTNQLSCKLANKRLSDITCHSLDFNNKSVVDIGCGDGVYTYQLLDFGAKSVLGVDPAKTAIKLANLRNKNKAITFKVWDIYSISSIKKKFDIAVVRGVLHHLYDLDAAVEQLSKIAKVVFVIEPNGENPVLKIIEILSSYHIKHEEKSYSTRKLDEIFAKHGGKKISGLYVGQVPFFCSEIVARVLKFIEPILELLPTAKYTCAVYVASYGFD